MPIRTALRALSALALLLALAARTSADTLLMADHLGFFPSGAGIKAVDSAGATPYTFNGAGGSMSFPRGITVGPDGNVYVGNEGTSSVERYSSSGAFIDEFVPVGGGGMVTAERVRFGPDGNLYVGAGGSTVPGFDGHIHKFNGTTGADLGAFTSEPGPTDPPGPADPRGFTWGPDGNLYVCGPTDGIWKYNGATGEFMSMFLFATGSPTFFPIDIMFDSSGDALVVDNDVFGSVEKFDGVTGAPMGTFISTGAGASELQRPEALLLGPDGNYYLSNPDKANVLRYAPDGTFIDVYASGGGLVSPTAMAFLPPVPEPAALGLVMVCCTALLRRR